MRLLIAVLSLNLLLAVSGLAADGPLAPGRETTWEFPDLPPTLRVLSLGRPEIPRVTVYLPEDYTPDRTFPLVVMIGGGDGGMGDTASFPRSIVGDRGHVCVSMPSYKTALAPMAPDETNRWTRIIIRPDDGPIIWRNYRVMLDQVRAAVPNLDPARSVFGGFSNGAHSAAAVLSHPQEAAEFLARFRYFVFVEGGHRIRPAADLTGAKFLLLRGGKRPEDIFLEQTKPRLKSATATWEEFVMPGVEHEFSHEGQAEVRRWIARQITPSES
jgi:hypothetical protein